MRQDSILVVEDNEDCRGLVRAALEQEGFAVAAVRSVRDNPIIVTTAVPATAPGLSLPPY